MFIINLNLLKFNKNKIFFIILIIVLCFVSGYIVNSIKDNERRKNEIRAVWMVTVNNANWPKTFGEESQKKEMVEYLDLLKNIGINRIYFQVRPRGDALYISKYWPWSYVLTGELGKDPMYDPLKYVIEECNKRNIIIEAWINPFLLGRCSSVDIENYKNKLPDSNPLKKHPEWIIESEGWYIMNLSNPEVRDIVNEEIVYIVENYNVPIHLDDYFYPYPSVKGNAVFNDSKEYIKHGNNLDIDDFRRSNVNDFIKKIYKSIKKINQNLTLSVSPFSIWKNKVEDGGAGTNGLESYSKLYCDSVYWVRNNFVDFIIPQVYWHCGYEIADYGKITKWWNKIVKGTRVKLIIGQAGYKLGKDSNMLPFRDTKEIIDQINFNRSLKNIYGQSIFSFECLKNNVLNICDELKKIYIN